MSIKSLAIAGLISAMACAVQADAMGKESTPSNAPPCAALIKSPADAVEKADWIVEGKLDSVIAFSNERNQLTLILSDMKSIKGGWPSGRGATGTVDVGDCIHEGKAKFREQAEGRLMGKRVRLMGSKQLDGHARQVFYIEPATAAIAATHRPSPFRAENRMHRR